MLPRRYITTLDPSLWKTLTAALATRYDKSASMIHTLIPKNTSVIAHGRVRKLEGGDTIQARKLVPLMSNNRDMSFVRV